MSLSSSRVRDVCLFLARLFFEACGQQKSKAEKAAVVAKLQALKFKMDIIFEMSELYMNYLRGNGAAGTFRTSLSRLVKDYIDAHYTEPAVHIAFGNYADGTSELETKFVIYNNSEYFTMTATPEGVSMFAEINAPSDPKHITANSSITPDGHVEAIALVDFPGMQVQVTSITDRTEDGMKQTETFGIVGMDKPLVTVSTQTGKGGEITAFSDELKLADAVALISGQDQELTNELAGVLMGGIFSTLGALMEQLPEASSQLVGSLVFQALMNQ